VSALAYNATEAQRVVHRDQKKKNKKAVYLIHQGMNDETFEQIEGATTASEAWIIFSVEDGCCPFKIVFDEDFYVHFICILLCFKCVLGSA